MTHMSHTPHRHTSQTNHTHTNCTYIIYHTHITHITDTPYTPHTTHHTHHRNITHHTYATHTFYTPHTSHKHHTHTTHITRHIYTTHHINTTHTTYHTHHTHTPHTPHISNIHHTPAHAPRLVGALPSHPSTHTSPPAPSLPSGAPCSPHWVLPSPWAGRDGPPAIPSAAHPAEHPQAAGLHTCDRPEAPAAGPTRLQVLPRQPMALRPLPGGTAPARTGGRRGQPCPSACSAVGGTWLFFL